MRMIIIYYNLSWMRMIIIYYNLNHENDYYLNLKLVRMIIIYYNLYDYIIYLNLKWEWLLFT